MSDRQWRENNVKTDDDVWDREDDLEGRLINIEHEVGPNKSTLYTIKQDDGHETKVWGSTVLDDRFLGVPEGTYVKVTYEGLKKGKNGKSYHNYRVFIDEGEAGADQSTEPDPEMPEMPPDWLMNQED